MQGEGHEVPDPLSKSLSPNILLFALPFERLLTLTIWIHQNLPDSLVFQLIISLIPLFSFLFSDQLYQYFMKQSTRFRLCAFIFGNAVSAHNLVSYSIFETQKICVATTLYLFV